jgi:prenyltransferase beta subunit
MDLVYDIKAHYDSSTGIFGNAASDNVVDQVWAILGLAASNANIPVEAAAWLANSQLEDGSWNDGWGSYLDTTPIALMALIASGKSDTNAAEVQSAIAFMQTQQDAAGGWLNEWDTITNADTTGMMLQTISVLGQLPMDERWQKHEGNPYSALLALQMENGSIGGDYANAYSTAEAILGLSGQPLFNLSHLNKINNAFDYLFNLQDSNGGWENVGQTIDVILVLKAAGWDPNSIKKDEETPLAFISNNLTSYIESGPDAIGKTMLGIIAMGENPSDVNGTDLLTTLMETYNQEIGAFGEADNTWHQAFAILGLHAASHIIPEEAVSTLVSLQQDDGGWEYSPGLGTSPDNTALAVQALLAAGLSSDETVIQSALNYIQSLQSDEGDWGDSSSTAYVIMALNALDISPSDWKTASGKAPLPALFSYQKANGSFVYNWENTDDNILATTAALLAALSGDFLVTLPASSNTNYAGLIVDTGDGEVTTVCLPFEESSLTGLELLEASGLEYKAADGMITTISGESASEEDSLYWSYWSFDGREWNFQNTGAGDSLVMPSSVEGWHLTSWKIYPSLPPDFIPSLSEICQAEVLKNYSIQPHMSYADLTQKINAAESAADFREESGAVEVAEEPTNETLETPEAQQVESERQVSERSQLPVYIIIGAGAILVVLFIFYSFRKKT